MKYRLKVTKQFKKDVKLCQRRGLPMEELKIGCYCGNKMMTK